jgi:hypothetical protein
MIGIQSPSEGTKMSLESLQDLLIDELKDLYSAEKQIVRALPKIIKAVSAAEVQDGLSKHLEETKNQVTRLEKIGESLGKKLTGKTCAGMKALKFNAVCSCPSGCCSRHNSSRSGGICERTAFVRPTFA